MVAEMILVKTEMILIERRNTGNIHRCGMGTKTTKTGVYLKKVFTNSSL